MCFISKVIVSQRESIGSEAVGFNYISAGFEVGSMNFYNRLG